MASIKLTLKKSDLLEGKPVKVMANGHAVMIVLVGGEIHAIDGVCSHRGGPLEQGKLEGYNIKCPWHGAIYDIRTGKADPKTPFGKGQAKYNIREGTGGELTLEM